jgi:signal transduction histidine kinase
MVIVAAIALSTMISNHVVMPLFLRYFRPRRALSGDLREVLLVTRRIAIGMIFGLGFLYFQFNGGTTALAAIGLIAFAGIAQVLPSLLGGIAWRGATAPGALVGLILGAALWAYTLFLPSFDGSFVLSKAVLTEGPWGIALLRPQALLGLVGLDPLLHSLIWSLGLNTLAFVLVSQITEPSPLERVQSALFVDVFHAVERAPQAVTRRTASAEDLFVLAQRILGVEPARRLFAEMAQEQGLAHGLPKPTDAVIARLERELSGSIGAASAHAMVSRAAGSEQISLTELMEIADETQRLIATSARLADKTAELERTAVQLREVNTRLRALDAQKDDFLSQVSHELRTPMTSIRSFSEILLGEDLDAAQIRRFTAIIHDESLRLTRLLDEILDISRIESGTADLPLVAVDAEAEVSAALATLDPLARQAGVTLLPRTPLTGERLRADPDRLRQVLINLVSNAIKYNTNPRPEVRIDWHVDGPMLAIDISDNGGGVSRDEADRIFAKFVRGTRSGATQGAGLGLPISRAVVTRMGGTLTLVFRADQTSYFRLRLPRFGMAEEGTDTPEGVSAEPHGALGTGVEPA